MPGLRALRACQLAGRVAALDLLIDEPRMGAARLLRGLGTVQACGLALASPARQALAALGTAEPLRWSPLLSLVLATLDLACGEADPLRSFWASNPHTRQDIDQQEVTMSAATLYSPVSSQALRASHDEAPTATGGRAQPVRMTMAEWKATHKDFKGSHKGPDGKRWRSVLRRSRLVRVEIIKE